MKLKPYPDLKLELLEAYSLLEGDLTEAEAWQVYAAIEFDHYDDALNQMNVLTGERMAHDAQEALAAIRRNGAQ